MSASRRTSTTGAHKLETSKSNNQEGVTMTKKIEPQDPGKSSRTAKGDRVAERKSGTLRAHGRKSASLKAHRKSSTLKSH